MRRHREEKMAVSKPRREALKNQTCPHLDLGLPVSRILRVNFCCLALVLWLTSHVTLSRMQLNALAPTFKYYGRGLTA